MDDTPFDQMDREFWVTAMRSTAEPSPAGIYDALLGGAHNTAADRTAAQRITRIDPRAPLVARANRAFLMRSVRHLVAAGIRQFLDLGSGYPTVNNVHQVAQAAAPEVSTVYVDIDPIAVAFSRHQLVDVPRVTAIPADLRRPEQVLTRLADPRLHDLLDLTQPVGLLMVAVTHFFSDVDDPYTVVARYVDALAPGSALALSHLAAESFDAEHVAAVQRLYAASGAPPPVTRTRDEVAAFFDGLRLLPPGLVYAPEWRSDDQAVPWDFPDAPHESGTHVGVALKPQSQ